MSADSIYERLGVRTVVNAAGFPTRLGGGPIDAVVLEAMAEAATRSVDMAELQAAASRIIAQITGGEAGVVTSGATAALELAAAACLAGSDPSAIDQLPNVDGRPREIVMLRGHRTGYDHGLRAAGALIRDVGYNSLGVQAGGRGVERWEIEQGISEQTVALAFTASSSNGHQLATMIDVGNAHGLPVIVDAAGQLPPRENLRAYLAAGAALVAFTGSKAIGGPHCTGFLAGRRDLIQAAALQCLDLDEDTLTWRPPPDLIDVNQVRGLPQHGIGRSLKVGKEEIVGLLVALRRFADGEGPGSVEDAREILERIHDRLGPDTGERVELVQASHGPTRPRLVIRFADAHHAAEASLRLKEANPPIFVNEQYLRQGRLVIDAISLSDRDVDPIVAGVADVLRGLRQRQ